MKKLFAILVILLTCRIGYADDKAFKFPTYTPIDVMSSNSSGYSTSKNITAGYYNGNGSLLTGISGGPGGGYVNFTTNETANISWPYTFNATQIQVNGVNITNGVNGTNGTNGTNGSDGVSVSNASVNATGFLNITLSNSTVLGPWNVTGDRKSVV
jgi:hypothetical protein